MFTIKNFPHVSSNIELAHPPVTYVIEIETKRPFLLTRHFHSLETRHVHSLQTRHVHFIQTRHAHSLQTRQFAVHMQI